MGTFKVGLLIISDTAFKDSSEDKTSEKIGEFFKRSYFDPGYDIAKNQIVPDDIGQIQSKIREWAQSDELKMILTSGGTGFSDRDITPEAVRPLLEKEACGIVHAMMSHSLKITPYAMMSRPLAGIINKTLVVTLPGSPKGAIENIEGIIGVLGHALKQIGSAGSRHLHKPELKEGESDKKVSFDSSHHCSHHDHHEHSHGSSHGAGHGVKRHNLSNDLSKPITHRARQSPYPMIEVSEAFNLINRYTPDSEIEVKQINDPLITGYIVAEDLYASINAPNFRASIVDGYAVINSDGPGVYKVVQVSHASPTTSSVLQRGTIARVTTGAPIPDGANAIVPVEETELISTKNNGEEEDEVKILAIDVAENDNIRDEGTDIAKGQLALRKGSQISPVGGEIGLLASIGITSIKVYKKPVIGVLSTGDELVDLGASCPTSELRLGQIYDTNRPLLLQTFRNWGYEAKDLGIAKDTSTTTELKLKQALLEDELDYIITTGGVSMGELDLLKPTIERKLGGVIHFGRVAMKPGKPTTFATVEVKGKTKVIFALPGNPASASVTSHLFVLPSLRKFSGLINIENPDELPGFSKVTVTLTKQVKVDARPEYQRVYIHEVEGELVADSTGFQRSSRVGSLAGANGLLVLPPRHAVPGGALSKGSRVQALVISVL